MVCIHKLAVLVLCVVLYGTYKLDLSYVVQLCHFKLQWKNDATSVNQTAVTLELYIVMLIGCVVDGIITL